MIRQSIYLFFFKFSDAEFQFLRRYIFFMKILRSIFQDSIPHGDLKEKISVHENIMTDHIKKKYESIVLYDFSVSSKIFCKRTYRNSIFFNSEIRN